MNIQHNSGERATEQTEARVLRDLPQHLIEWSVYHERLRILATGFVDAMLHINFAAFGPRLYVDFSSFYELTKLRSRDEKLNLEPISPEWGNVKEGAEKVASLIDEAFLKTYVHPHDQHCFEPTIATGRLLDALDILKEWNSEFLAKANELGYSPPPQRLDPVIESRLRDLNQVSVTSRLEGLQRGMEATLAKKGTIDDHCLSLELIAVFSVATGVEPGSSVTLPKFLEVIDAAERAITPDTVIGLEQAKGSIIVARRLVDPFYPHSPRTIVPVYEPRDPEDTGEY